MDNIIRPGQFNAPENEDQKSARQDALFFEQTKKADAVICLLINVDGSARMVRRGVSAGGALDALKTTVERLESDGFSINGGEKDGENGLHGGDPLV